MILRKLTLTLAVSSSLATDNIRGGKCFHFPRNIKVLNGPSCFSSVQSLSHVRLFETPWIAARQASLSITNSWNSLKLMSIVSVMPSSHLILCSPLLLLPPIPPSIRVFSSESTLCMKWPNYWSFSFSIGPFSECSGLSSFRIDRSDLLAVQGPPSIPISNHKPVPGRNQSIAPQRPHSAPPSRAPPGPVPAGHRETCSSAYTPVDPLPPLDLFPTSWDHHPGQLFTGQSLSQPLLQREPKWRQNPQVSPLWVSPREWRWAGSRSLPQAAWYKLQHFPWLYRLGNCSNNGIVTSFCSSDTIPLGTLFPSFPSYTWHLTQ